MKPSGIQYKVISSCKRNKMKLFLSDVLPSRSMDELTIRTAAEALARRISMLSSTIAVGQPLVWCEGSGASIRGLGSACNTRFTDSETAQ